ncbi:hypothetical protein C5167_029030 [Papaver somniferum]|uniref:uncharacterized protein LOC113337283 n=1 Tax=Papaver somniferum TaxID=3469 RepID=UPI000E6FFA82|nr:uncharacterized protein LOC113337283 [Papaver somniferum]RZC89963.1 hypothetical protein C5167_029030 [Papaver somniferum]
MPFMGTGAVGDNLVVVPAVIGFKDHQFKPPKQLNVNTFKDSPPPFGGKRSQESLKNQKARKRNAKDNSASPLVSPLHSKSFAWKLAAAIGTTDDDDGFDFKTEHKTASLQDAAAEPVHTVDDVPDIQQPSLDGKDDHMSEKDQLVPRLETGVAGDSQPRVEDPGGDPVNGMILERQGSILKQNEELQFEVDMHVPEVVQVDSYSKANQELNDLQMKANELEKLFEQHKRRVLGDHSTSKKLPSDSNSGKELDANSITSMVVDHEDYGRFSNSGASKLKMEVDFPESKGKFYDRYVEKRDAKLREELAQKEAKMKAMEESLERNRAEMEAKFSGYSSRNQDSNLNARCRAERLRSFNIRSTDENNEQVSFIDSVDDEFPENNLWELRRSLPWESTDVSSSNSAAKKVVSSNRTSSSSIPRTSTIPITKSLTKPSHSPLNKRRTMLENSKASPTHRQRKYNRSKSNIDEFSISKEFKPREAQSLRNSSARESKDASSVIAERVDQTNKASKPFLKKGSGVGPGAGANVAKLKALTASENLKSEKELDESPQKMQEDPVAVLVKVEEEAEAHSDPLIEEQGFMAANAAVISENENLMLKWESEKSSHSGFRNSEVLELFSQVDPNAVAEAAALPSTLHGIIEPMQDFIEESTGSRNPLVQPTFSSSDDACLESPIGSHSSWNSQSLTKLESEVMMRNKSGRTIVPANTSHHHYRKDVKKGIKRLLKFGKKSKKKESIVGWVSPATTSDADYDNVESRDDNSNRPSDELQKSRLGYPESRTSYDSFSNSEVYSEQAKRSSNPAASEMFKPREDRISGGSSKAPRSFFSLSSFRTKRSESKSRLKESYNSY